MEILGLNLASEFDNVAGEFFADGFSDYNYRLGDGLGEGLVYELVVISISMDYSVQIGSILTRRTVESDNLADLHAS